MALDFYTRLRFTENLLPQLRRAASPSGVDTSNNPSPVSHVVTVLGGGNEQPVNVDDLSLKNNYTLNTATQHAVTMNTLAFDHLASKPENAGISFVHTSPGMVKTQGARELGTLFYIGVSIFAFLFKPLTVPVGECGERHLWAGTNKSLQGGAVHLINKNSEIIRNLKVLKDMKDRGVAEKVWEHTRTVFTKVCTEGGKYEA
nr:uncharacterized protein CTRU02_07305 [Colletotrichum truncatum]KAF6791543.1 hypothetical protein CTRU02_07305 [Colletotrichum truncatum]